MFSRMLTLTLTFQFLTSLHISGRCAVEMLQKLDNTKQNLKYSAYERLFSKLKNRRSKLECETQCWMLINRKLSSDQ